MCGVPVASYHRLAVSVLLVSSTLFDAYLSERTLGGRCCTPRSVESSTCAIRHTWPVQRGFVGTGLGRCSTADEKKTRFRSVCGQVGPLFSHHLPLVSPIRDWSGDSARTSAQPLRSWFIFITVKERRGSVIRPLYWPMTHHSPPSPTPKLPSCCYPEGHREACQSNT